jgi:hypothetical protein
MAYTAVIMGVLIGALLGGLNVAVVAVVLSAIDKRRDAETIVTMRELPGKGTATTLGPVAQLTATRSRRAYVGLFVVAAIALMFGVASLVGMQIYVAAASIPTVVAALGFERWARRGRPAPIPVATARSIIG